MRRVIVHIDRLVLTGFRPEDRDAIAAGIEQELGRVCSNREAVSVLRHLGDILRLPVSGVQLEPGSNPQRVGERVAQGIGKEISK
jgi:hypothetical protein